MTGMNFIRVIGTLKCKAPAGGAAGLCILMLLAGMLLGGCRTNDTCPLIPAIAMELGPDPAGEVQIPGDSYVFDTDIDPSCAETLAAKQYSLPEYPLASAALPPASEVDSICVIRKGLSDTPSPYTSGSYLLVHRVILKTKSGSYFYTRPFGVEREKTAVAEKYMSLDALSFSSPDGVFAADGVLRTKPTDPMRVVMSGYTATVAVRDSNISEMLVVPPSLTGLSSLDFSGANGSYGPSGSYGGDGYCGRDGSGGQWPGLLCYVRCGSDGYDGENGRPGGDGGDGHGGEDGDGAGTIRISVVPVSSPFFEQPVQAISIVSTTGRARTVVLAWGSKLSIDASGGNGGNGGDGGNGGRGGSGGSGGRGGDGSNGASGSDGRDGCRGESGCDATRNGPGGRGGRGGPGGPGEDGVDGGDGGNGGNGGNGASGGDGGNGGRGGDGGRGANVTVTVQGTDKFVQMVKAGLAIDVRGGCGGSGGDAGSGGSGGSAGSGGYGGLGGNGGSGGHGGRGGPGGHGGREFREDEHVRERDSRTNEEHVRTVTRSHPGGGDGDRGPDGTDGRDGKDGRPGLNGRDGICGSGGQNGAVGGNGGRGSSGTVGYVTKSPVKYAVSGDIRVVDVATGRIIQTANADGGSDDLKKLADTLVAGMLRDGLIERDATVVVATMHDRSCTMAGRVVAEELADKINGRLLQTRLFEVAERIDLSAVLDEKEVTAAFGSKLFELPQQAVARLAGIRYLVLGSTTTSEIVLQRN